jgi:hypothetical protein
MLPFGEHGLQTIEAWGRQSAKGAVGPVILENAPTAPRPGTAAIQVIRRIYAPKTITATSAAR